MALARDGDTTLFSGNAAGTLRLIAYAALACVLMVIDRRVGVITHVRYTASVLIEPVFALASLPAKLANFASTSLVSRHHLSEENAHLREALLLANARLNRMHVVAGQNQRLQELLDVRRQLGMDVQLAHVVGVDIGAFRHRIVLDVGADQGVKVGQAIIDAHGVMGQVTQVQHDSSRAILVSDPNHSIPVVDERTGLRTVASGSGVGDQLVLRSIPLTADVRVGDRLLTSGLGGRFPAGFPVGTVASVAPDEAHMFARAQVTPAAALDRSGEVLLLRDLPPPVGPPAPAPAVGPPASLAGQSAAAGAR
ncbi:MAG TPA: rod shape-determining protein MreC [Rhodanobacteraceae bacterium]|nr:rod shape-determining protein MreC [Rhodanobacteraceae bacterium]